MIRDIKHMSDLKASRIPSPNDPKLTFGVVVFLVRANFKEPRSISVTDFTSAYQDQNTPVFHIAKGDKSKRLNLKMDVLRDRYNAPDVCDFMNEGKFILLHCQVAVSQKDGVPNFQLFSFNNLNQHPADALSLCRQSVMKVKSLLMDATTRNPALKDSDTDFKGIFDTICHTEVVTPSQTPQESIRKKIKLVPSPSQVRKPAVKSTPPIIVNPLFAPFSALMGSQIALEEPSQADRLDDDSLTSFGEHTENAPGVVDLTLSQISEVSGGSDIEELTESQVAREKLSPINASQISGVVSISTFSTQESSLKSVASEKDSQDKEEPPSQSPIKDGSGSLEQNDSSLLKPINTGSEDTNQQIENYQDPELLEPKKHPISPEAQVSKKEVSSQELLPLEINSQNQLNAPTNETDDPRMIEKWVKSAESNATDSFEMTAHLIAFSPFRPRIIGKSFNARPGVIPFQLFVSNLPRSSIDTLLPDKNCFVVDFSTEESIMKFIGYDDIEKAYTANVATYDKLMDLVKSDVPVRLNLNRKRRATGCWYKDVWECEETLDEIFQLIR